MSQSKLVKINKLSVGKKVQGVPKKMGFVIVVIVAPKNIFKLTPILLDINMPYGRVNLSYCGGHYDKWLCFYGHFSLRGFRYFCQNYGILTRKFKCSYGCRITKCLFKRLGKVVLGHNLLVFEVMHEK